MSEMAEIRIWAFGIVKGWVRGDGKHPDLAERICWAEELAHWAAYGLTPAEKKELGAEAAEVAEGTV